MNNNAWPKDEQQGISEDGARAEISELRTSARQKRPKSDRGEGTAARGASPASGVKRNNGKRERTATRGPTMEVAACTVHANSIGEPRNSTAHKGKRSRRMMFGVEGYVCPRHRGWTVHACEDDSTRIGEFISNPEPAANAAGEPKVVSPDNGGGALAGIPEHIGSQRGESCVRASQRSCTNDTRIVCWEAAQRHEAETEQRGQHARYAAMDVLTVKYGELNITARVMDVRAPQFCRQVSGRRTSSRRSKGYCTDGPLGLHTLGSLAILLSSYPSPEHGDGLRLRLTPSSTSVLKTFVSDVRRGVRDSQVPVFESTRRLLKLEAQCLAEAVVEYSGAAQRLEKDIVDEQHHVAGRVCTAINPSHDFLKHTKNGWSLAFRFDIPLFLLCSLLAARARVVGVTTKQLGPGSMSCRAQRVAWKDKEIRKVGMPVLRCKVEVKRKEGPDAGGYVAPPRRDEMKIKGSEGGDGCLNRTTATEVLMGLSCRRAREWYCLCNAQCGVFRGILTNIPDRVYECITQSSQRAPDTSIVAHEHYMDGMRAQVNSNRRLLSMEKVSISALRRPKAEDTGLSQPDFTGFDLRRLVHAGKLEIAFGELQEKQNSFKRLLRDT
ncbi:hypothetical protein B0H13DRAFT_1913878 [Mycena leptocephala]|nr:hypothetical protein B0H13DRAFT_1913878 [Mycena leptocephala]